MICRRGGKVVERRGLDKHVKAPPAGVRRTEPTANRTTGATRRLRLRQCVVELEACRDIGRPETGQVLVCELCFHFGGCSRLLEKGGLALGFHDIGASNLASGEQRLCSLTETRRFHQTRFGRVHEMPGQQGPVERRGNGPPEVTANDGKNMVNFLRGQTQHEAEIYRDRQWALGDTVNAARVYAELGAWDQAAADLARAIALGARDDGVWYQHALVQLARGDTESYRQTCAALLDRFGKTQVAGVADTVARACALAPNALSGDARTSSATAVLPAFQGARRDMANWS